MSMHQYRSLTIMSALSFIAMYFLMYAMIDNLGSLYHSINQIYMAGLMTAPMVIFEILIMHSMYPNKKANRFILASSVLALAVFFAFIRQQTAVGDVQFLRSMIPHHSGAILMCGKANLQDQEIKDLCKTIIAGQQAEIDQMKAILNRKK